MTDVLFMLKMIAAAVTKKKSPEAPDGVNWERILKISSMHSVSNIVAHAILNGSYEIPQEIKEKFIRSLYLRIAVSENQKAEIEKILNAFEKSGIDHMPVKGVILAKLYPSFDMRVMSDADILIRKEQHTKADSVMKELGYEFEIEGPIEYNYKKRPYVHIELHHCLMAPSSEDLYDYYKDSWKFAKKSDLPYRYDMSTEDQFIYVFTHFTRHYRDAGAGIKAIIDLWLYAKEYPDMDWDYIYRELEKVNMKEFFDNLMRLIKVWFEGREMDNVTLEMTKFIVSSGTFGTIQNSISAKSVREFQDKDLSDVGKNKYLRLFFPKMEYMKTLFPILEKCPVLLPPLWVWRLIRGALFKRKNIAVHKRNAEYTDSGSAKRYYEHMKTVGLDIYNGRKN